MILKFIGVGSAFSTQQYWQSNALLIAPSGKKLLIDCGTDARFSLQDSGFSHRDIDAVYISHLHADHVGGMEWLAFLRFFDKGAGERPHLFMVDTLMEEMWEHTLRGGLESIEGRQMTLTDYFRCHAVKINDSFIWEGWIFTPIQTVHIMSGYKIKSSYGLIVNHQKDDGRKIFFTADTQFCPNQIMAFYDAASLIFQDCETAPYKSKVHAAYDDLKTLPEEIRRKMWLYHYQPNPPQDAVQDGFKGFVQKGQEINVSDIRRDVTVRL